MLKLNYSLTGAIAPVGELYGCDLQKGDREATQEEIDLYNSKISTIEAKENISLQLEKLTVTTSNGNVFDAMLEARQNMADAIIASSTLGSTTTTWRMADNSEVIITLDELKEAHALAIKEYARIKGIGV